MKKRLLVMAMLTLWYNVNSQTNVTVLDLNSSSAVITDGGLFFNNPLSAQSGYEVPKGSGLNLIYSMGFWFAGTDQNGILRNSCVRYSNNSDIFPGPVSTTNAYNDAAYLAAYTSSLWTVSKAEVLIHQSNWSQIGYVIPSSIANWPGNGVTSVGVAENLAPFIDMNGNNIYEPELGDYPDIRGDKATYVIMNDVKAPHTGSNGQQMGIEVHSMFYQYASSDFMDTTTFFNVRVYNRGSYVYDDFKMAIYMDGDIGNFSDDYAGSDPYRNMMYMYNGDGFDEDNGGTAGYGVNPPALGILSLKQGMQVCGTFSNASMYPYNDPNVPAAFWNMMGAKWSDGSPWYYGGLGYIGSPGVTTTTTNFMYSGDPESGMDWSEVSNNNPSGDRRVFMVMDSINLISGATDCYDFAVLYGKGNSNLNSVTVLKEIADQVQSFYDSQIDFNCNQVTLGLGNGATQFDLKIYPNPTEGRLFINSSQINEMKKISLVDALGKEIPVRLNFSKNNIEISFVVESGIYFLRIENESSQHMERIIVR